MKKIINYFFGTKHDTRVTLYFIGAGLLGGLITGLLGAPWWLTTIAAILTPAAFYYAAMLLFVIIILGFLGG